MSDSFVHTHAANTSLQSGAVTSATILLFNIKSGSRSGLTLDTSNEMADVYRCMNLLKDCEKRWPMAGRLWYSPSSQLSHCTDRSLHLYSRDILSGLASTVDALPFTSQTIPMNKRKRALYELDPGPVASKDHASTLVSRVSASSSIGLSGHEAPSWSVNDLLIDESEQFRDVFAAPSNIPSTLVTGMAGDTLFTWPAVTNTSECVVDDFACCSVLIHFADRTIGKRSSRTSLEILSMGDGYTFDMLYYLSAMSSVFSCIKARHVMSPSIFTPLLTITIILSLSQC
jgi:hypothetical protein